MRCINKAILSGLLIVSVYFLAACSLGKETEIANRYDVFKTSGAYGITGNSTYSEMSLFAEDLCVADTEDIATDQFDSSLSVSSAVFDLTDRTVNASQKIYEQMYPASTTKILTGYLAVKYGNLSDTVTVSESAVDLPSDSSNCGLKAGDTLTLEQLLYGLLLCSGNDAANAIAEHISGNNEAFVALMNEEAAKMGATRSHFMNPHGLHDENHYTCAYDLYLIFNEACKNEQFYQLISTHNYTANYTSASGEATEQSWESTNQYFNGNTAVPENVTVIGGKTGTTNSAGNCLVLLSQNSKNELFISIVLKAENRENLYTCMTELLTNFTY
ncbi:MAG: D-alanyl-D-alanine carboxypeptidase [Eubacterium sp.]|nr:D-alanyl-D-alanine carboxypeptidase [Eubacterium sp.]